MAKRLLAAAFVAAAVLAWGGLRWHAHEATAQRSQPAAAPVPVEVASATRQDVAVTASGIGTVQAWQSVPLQPQVGGRLQAIYFREGEHVREGALLAMIDPRPYQAALAQAEAKLAGDEATAANAKTTLARDSALAQKNFASRQQVDNDTALLRTAEAATLADKAAITTAKLNLGYCRITAPTAGVVGLRRVDVGTLLQAGNPTPIATLNQIEPIAVVFTLPQRMLGRIEAARAAGNAKVEVFAADPRRLLATGTLVTQDNAIDQSTGTIALKAKFANAGDRLWPGQFVTAKLQLGVQRNATVIPATAVQHGPDGLYAYVVGADRKVTARPLRAGVEDGGKTEILSGLSPGEVVVVNGQSRLQPGVTVSIRPNAG